MDTTKALTTRERASLTALCEAFQPALAAERGDDPALFGVGAAQLGVPAAAEQALARVGRAELRQFLRLLDTKFVGFVCAQVGRGVTRMSVSERERLLQTLSSSPIPQMRSGFQALKRLTNF